MTPHTITPRTMTPTSPRRWDQLLSEVTAAAATVDGWLLPDEIRFLALLAAAPTAAGRVVELGAYRGKSTVILALASRLSPAPGIVSVDPIDPRPLLTNLDRAGVGELVELHSVCSHEFWPNWRDPIRLLWHDGANQRSIVQADVASALPYLADGAIVAFHDVRNPSGERLHVFVDEVLGSPHFGASGVCGTLGWSQYRVQAAAASGFQDAKDRLRRQLIRLRPYHDLSQPPPSGWHKYRYKVLRWLVPHAAVAPDQWWRQVSTGNANLHGLATRSFRKAS